MNNFFQITTTTFLIVLSFQLQCKSGEFNSLYDGFTSLAGLKKWLSNPRVVKSPYGGGYSHENELGSSKFVYSKRYGDWNRKSKELVFFSGNDQSGIYPFLIIPYRYKQYKFLKTDSRIGFKAYNYKEKSHEIVFSFSNALIPKEFSFRKQTEKEGDFELGVTKAVDVSTPGFVDFSKLKLWAARTAQVGIAKSIQLGETRIYYSTRSFASDATATELVFYSEDIYSRKIKPRLIIPTTKGHYRILNQEARILVEKFDKPTESWRVCLEISESFFLDVHRQYRPWLEQKNSRIPAITTSILGSLPIIAPHPTREPQAALI